MKKRTRPRRSCKPSRGSRTAKRAVEEKDSGMLRHKSGSRTRRRTRPRRSCKPSRGQDREESRGREKTMEYSDTRVGAGRGGAQGRAEKLQAIQRGRTAKREPWKKKDSGMLRHKSGSGTRRRTRPRRSCKPSRGAGPRREPWKKKRRSLSPRGSDGLGEVTEEGNASEENLGFKRMNIDDDNVDAVN